ncbi:ATP-binding protein [Acaryochloris sp. CCMEE 5410]|uniref:ATP-binding protein n=1 Tax=Acaryochloris sp. CCMEE 5410 TaxID=310037 RepID=UPI0002483CD6|nr:ATP-binding protein [Acaryochloris sp. CCMEE 5410]KAI9130032.1 ATP-binding protein [Acaryochloris sp. CCMEE 5410]
MVAFLEEVDFLKQEVEEEIRLEAENLLSSYSQFHDVLAESLQNAVDSVDDRYHQEPTTAVAKISLKFDIPKRTITVTDTGTGMPWSVLKNALKPNVTYKRVSKSSGKQRRSRGEKGVGFSFLTFTSNRIRVKTCNGTETIEVVVEGAHDYVKGITGERPMLKPMNSTPDGVSRELGSTKYTVLEMTDVSTVDYCDRDIFDISLPELMWTLRTRTAVGNTDPVVSNRTPEPEIEITLQYISVEGEETIKQVPYCYESPEELISEQSKISFEKFQDYVEKRKLHLARGKALVYRNTLTTASGRSIHCYSFSMAPKAFDDLTSDMSSEEGWSPPSWVGIHIATRGMPTGIFIEPPITGSAFYWRRVFMLLQDDEMNFDVGRKTLRGRAKPMMQDISKTIWKDILGYLQSLTPADPEAVTRRKQGKLQLLFQKAHEWKDLNFGAIQYKKEPQREQMVVALFYELVGANILKGYQTLRNNTIDQYDAFIYYSIPKKHIGKFQANSIREELLEDQIIIEFKHKAEDILRDILDNKKTYQDINLLVCWKLNKSKFEKNNIDVELVPEESVYYFGSTHILYFPGIYQAGESLTVIELKTFLDRTRPS